MPLPANLMQGPSVQRESAATTAKSVILPVSSLDVWSHTDANYDTIQLDTVWLCRLAGYVRVYEFQ